MKGKYFIVLFKNRKKRKIIKRFVTEKNAINFYTKLIDENKKIIFDKKIENATFSEYHLGLITNQVKTQKTIYFIDEVGRNNLVDLDDPDHIFLRLDQFLMEELLYDWQSQSKISFGLLIKKYFSDNNFKSVFTINNKLCIQNDENINLFSLKSKYDSLRLLEVIEDFFMSKNKSNCIFVKDVSSAQRKWLYNILENKGIDKKKLYRTKTTFSKR